jgi:anti-sigma-K factor RskA
MRCEEIRELLALHALGALESGETEAVRRHVELGCPRCAADLAALHEALAAMPFALPSQEPSPMAEARLMAAIRKDLPTSPVPAPVFWGKAGLVAAAAAIVFAFLTGAFVSRRYEAQAQELRAQIRSQQAELARLEQQFRRTRDTISLVRSPGSRVIDLQGQDSYASSAARIFWDVRKGTWRLYADNLPPAGEGRTYQLWLITPSEKISAGVFDPQKDEEPSGTVTIPKAAGQVVAAAVTPEPAGGSPQPTGSILLLGKI